mgnify:CR=1 FL=1
MSRDTRDRCREARGLESEGEACLDLFFLCFLDLPNRDDDKLDLTLRVHGSESLISLVSAGGTSTESGAGPSCAEPRGALLHAQG